MAPDLIDPKQYRKLFLDDGDLVATQGTTRTLHPPKKFGPLIKGGVQSRSAPIWNPEKAIWEWWYMGQGARYATSVDGEHWEKPSLGRYEWEGSKDNNIACDPNGMGLYHIIRDEHDTDPRRRYKALFSSGNRQAGVSPDGFTWTMLDSVSIPSQDESQFCWDPYTEQYLALVKQGTEWGRSVWLSTSKDFDHFTGPKLIFHADETDWENCRQRVRKIIDNPAYITPPLIDDEDYIAEIYNMAVLPYQGLYIGFPTVFNPFGAIPPPATNFTRINQIEMSVSRDLYTWERVANRTPFIGIEPFDGENYGTSQLLMSGPPIIRDNGEIWAYYNALRMPGSVEMYRRFNRAKELFRLGNVQPRLFFKKQCPGKLETAFADLEHRIFLDSYHDKVGLGIVIHLRYRVIDTRDPKFLGYAFSLGPGATVYAYDFHALGITERPNVLASHVSGANNGYFAPTGICCLHSVLPTAIRPMERPCHEATVRLV